MDQIDIFLNKIAQSRIPISEGIKAYDTALKEEQQNIFFSLELFVAQAKPTATLIESAILKSSLNIGTIQTQTIIQAFRRNPFNQGLSIVYNIEDPKEHREACILLLFLFKEADTYRRNTECKGGCKHPWHNI